jgi:dipeptidase
MCDTMIALGSATADGSVLFAKNSDRDPNEAQEIVHFPARDYQAGSEVKCTYRSIPQVEHTHAVLLSRPFWIWGAEMGANEHGVVIGNEAVFTRVPQEKGPALLGMDLLRLGLERGKTAHQALDVITKLLETYGQGGNCGFAHPMYYHNSFLIGDRQEAWILETAGREWAARRAGHIQSISNFISIENEWDMTSPGLVDYAVKRGWCKGRDDFSFSRCYSEPVYTRFGAGRYRQSCSTSLLQEICGKLTPSNLMQILRHHGSKESEEWTPDRAVAGAEVCMHFGFGPIRINQTTGSMVSQISREGTIHWLTGTSAPCTSIFKPFWVESGQPADYPAPKGTSDDQSLWWQHEQLHRRILQDYPARIHSFQNERDILESEFILGAAQSALQNPVEKLNYSQACLEAAAEAEREWIQQLDQMPLRHKNTFYYRNAWKKINQQGLFKEV